MMLHVSRLWTSRSVSVD